MSEYTVRFCLRNVCEDETHSPKLIEAALVVVLADAAAAAGQLPRLVQTVRVAQLQLLKGSGDS